MIPHVLLTMDMPDFTNPSVIFGLLTLTFLEIVLGIDNIIFISIISNKLALQDQPTARRLGLILAMLMRIVLLFGISALVAMKSPWFSVDFLGIHAGFTGQSLILLVGGIFLLYKAVTEIHHKLEGESNEEAAANTKSSLNQVILQITIINIVFSFDSILTAVGMTNGVEGALVIMVIAVVVSVLIMMLFAVPVGRFVNEHPTFQMLGLAFLILIGFTLILEAAHLAHFEIGGSGVSPIPKGYLYFAIAFSLGVEFLNMKLRKKSNPVLLHGINQEAADSGIFK